MSYNIRGFKVKSVVLVLPVGFKIEDFIEGETGRESETRIVVESDLERWSFNEDGEGLTLSGTVTEMGLEVTELSCTGEGSGNDYSDVLKPLFAKFRGDLGARIVWEDGEVTEVVITKGRAVERRQD